MVVCATIPVWQAPAEAKPAPSRAAASEQVFDTCSWDRPGHDKFSGDVASAVDRYPDIPQDVRRRLKQRMVARDYDDMVSIRRDSIGGKREYDSAIRDMHFGAGNVCRSVTRAGWSDAMHERGMVYCESGHCILVPTVCRNVSRIVRRAAAAPIATAAMAEGGGGGAAQGDLPFEVPGAGTSFTGTGAPGPAAGTGGSGTSFASQSAGGWRPDRGLGDAWPGWSEPLGVRQGRRIASGGGEPVPPFVPSPGSPGSPLPGPLTGPVLPAPVIAVPEPQTWLLLAGGLVLLGAVTRRRSPAGHSPTAR